MTNGLTDKKQYVVWYNGGSGGFIVSWLIQLCIDPSLLDRAFENFPSKLKTDHLKWQKYEQVPPNVGLLCNAFNPSVYYTVDIKEYTMQIVNKIISNSTPTLYDLFYCRSKYFLVNHVYNQGNFTLEKYKKVSVRLSEYRTTDIKYFKEQTDILFDTTKNIFVCAPAEYQKITEKTKLSKSIAFDVTEVLVNYPMLKCFNIQSIWQRSYIKELESALGYTISDASKQAIEKLVDYYIDITPIELRNYCEEQWSI